MTGLSPYAAAPPPPPIQAGGSRKNKHIVGGQTSNVSYMPGANLLAARQGFQGNQDQGQPQNSPMARGFFQGNVAEAPDFTQTAVNALPSGQGLTSAQAAGNTLFQNSLGNIRAANAPSGLGYGRSNALGVVRQHTLTGNEAVDPGVTYTPTTPTPAPPTTTTTAPPPPPVAPTGTTQNPGYPTAPIGGTSIGGLTTPPGTQISTQQMADEVAYQNTAISQINAGNWYGYLNSTNVMVKNLALAKQREATASAPPTPPVGQPPTTPAPAPPVPPAPGVSWDPSAVRARVTAGGGIKVGNYLPGPGGVGTQGITGLKKYGNVYLPLVGTGANQQVHWAYRELM